MPPLAEPSSLRQHHARHLDRLGERPRLRDAVLPGLRVEHQQGLVDLGPGLLDDPLDLAELVHQRRLRVQTARGVDDQHVGRRGRSPTSRRRTPPRRGRRRAPARRGARPPAAPRPRAVRRPRRGTCRPPPGSPACPSATSRLASLPIVVVLPEPFTPTTMTTPVRPSAGASGSSGPEDGDDLVARAASTGSAPCA